LKAKQRQKVSGTGYSQPIPTSYVNSDRDWITMEAPEQFSLFDNFKDTYRFLVTLDDFLKAGERVFITLSKVEILGLEAILVLLSIILEGANRKGGPLRYVRGDMPADLVARELLTASGFFDYVRSSYPIPRNSKFKGSIERDQGLIVDTALAQRLSQQAIENTITKDQTRKGIYVTLVELMGNTREHADPKAPQTVKWWAILLRDEGANTSQFVFFDRGAGILDTVRTKLQKLAAMVPFMDNQTRLLQEVFNGSLPSRTGLSYRGKGLPAIHQYASERKHLSKLRVLTNKVRADVLENNFEELPSNFKGTLFSWEVT
jgi:hypothetical protein